MNFWDFFFDSEYRQRKDINRQSESIDYANSKVYELNKRVRSLETELAETKKECKVMRAALIEQGLVREEYFPKQVKKSAMLPPKPNNDWQKNDWTKEQPTDEA